jgi:hypothetical protein
LYFRSWNASTESFDTEQAVSGNDVENNTGGNHMLLADVRADDATDNLHAVYTEIDPSYDIWYDTRVSGSWGTDVELRDAVNASWIRAEVFTHSAGNGGGKVVGYIWDDSESALDEAGGTGFTRYDEYGLTTPTTFTQNDFRWYENADSVTLSNLWGSIIAGDNEDVHEIPAAYNPPGPGEQMRLQINITVGTANLSATTQAFKLQFKAGTDQDCSTGSWTDIGAKAATTVAWRLFDNGSLGDTATEVNQISTSDVAGGYSELVTSGTNPNAVNTGQDMEWDWPIESVDGQVVSAATYAFRMVKSDGTAISYTAGDCPTVETEPGTANLMRHGNVFVDGVEKGFFWAN